MTVTGSLLVSGSGTFTNIGPAVMSGSLNVSGAIVTNSTITAQTLVVQTITSSVSVITGSTNWGSLSSNTHTFTGSIYISGSNTTLNYIPKISGSGLLTNSLIYSTGVYTSVGTTATHGNVTIEQTTGETGLVVNSSIAESPKLYLRDAGSAGYSEIITNNKLYINSKIAGLGVIPNTWNSSYKALQIGASMSLLQDGSTASSYWGGNLYVGTDGNYRYIINGGGGLFGIESGALVYYGVASGTAGNVASLVERFNITTSGEVLFKQRHITVATGTSNDIGVWVKGVGTYSSGYASIQSFASDVTYDTKLVLQENGGNVLIGTLTNVGQKVRIYQPATGEWNMKMVQPNGSDQKFQEFLTTTNGDASATARGSITYNGTNVLFTGTSDYRLKEDLKDYNGLNVINQLKTYDFKWKEAGTRDYGMMAHELQSVLPNCVNGEKDALNEDGSIKPQGVDYSKLVPVLVKAIQEQNALITSLQTRIEQLENK
jgi:hypothetical protein